MLILACDTSNTACSVCLYEDGRVLAQSLLSIGKQTHSLTFMPMVHDLMIRSGHDYKDLDALACAVGPGSFTGIRIGVSAVKSMAMVIEKPAVPVSSLKALAFPFLETQNTLVVAMTDARNRRVFSAAYYQGKEVVSENARTIDELIVLCRAWEEMGVASDTRILLCGDIASTYAKEEYFLKKNASVPILFGREVQPESVAALAFETISRTENLHELFPAKDLSPVYRAKTAAERMFPKASEMTGEKKPENVPPAKEDGNHA